MKELPHGYTATIGLEVHAELHTNTKMFCACKNDPFAAAPNTHICPVCTAQPGTLPVVNKKAVEYVLRVGAAIDADLADFTEFDRKNYFYPDIPKAYQISQLEYPLVSNGVLAGVDITRIHLEEDTATSSHETNHSLAEFNRAGVPLMELVTEPAIHDAETAMKFGKELQLLLRTLGVSEANLEKGEMRIEANISVSQTETFGTKVEVKNLNSFKIVGAAIDYEIDRQIEALENGETLVQETRGWNEQKQSTFSQRVKESSDDYRYFPDPDIPKFKLSELEGFSKEEIAKRLPELPWDKRTRYQELGVANEAVETFLSNKDLDALFIGVIEKTTEAKELKLAVNYITSDVAGLVKNAQEGSIMNITSDEIYNMIVMIQENKLSSRGAKDLITHMFVSGGSAQELAERYDLIQSSNTDELKVIVEQIFADNPDMVQKLKDGDEKLIALADSRRLMGLTYANLCELEVAYLKKDEKLIGELASKWKSLKKEGHKKYTDD